jgi:hypothetical protein
MTERILGVALRDRVTGRTWVGDGVHADVIDDAARDLRIADRDALADRLVPGFTTDKHGFVTVVESLDLDRGIRSMRRERAVGPWE